MGVVGGAEAGVADGAIEAGRDIGELEAGEVAVDAAEEQMGLCDEAEANVGDLGGEGVEAVSGNKAAAEAARETALPAPGAAWRRKIERVRLEGSTKSGSTMVIAPTPSRPRALTTSLPSAPAPTTRACRERTLAGAKRVCSRRE